MSAPGGAGAMCTSAKCRLPFLADGRAREATGTRGGREEPATGLCAKGNARSVTSHTIATANTRSAAAAAALVGPGVVGVVQLKCAARQSGGFGNGIQIGTCFSCEPSTWQHWRDPSSCRAFGAGGKSLRTRRPKFSSESELQPMDLDTCRRRWPHDLNACTRAACRAMSGNSARSSMEKKGDEAVSVSSLDRAVMGDPEPLSSSIKLPTWQDVADDLGTPEVRVGYQGVPGAYSEAAAHLAYPNCEPVPCDKFESTFLALEQWAVDRAVLPIENTLGGSIHRNYDLLLRHKLHIVGEVLLDVHHCLLVLPGVKREDVKRVISHPQALAQCERNLTAIFGSGLIREAVDDTAGAAKHVADEALRDTAAVASIRAGEIYGLSVLNEGIEDESDNITRFLALAREPLIPHIGGDYKTSIVFTLESGPGVLFKALAAFSLRGINLTKIESRPQRNKPLQMYEDSLVTSRGGGGGGRGQVYRAFDYLFYIDFQASMAEPRAQNALRNMEEFSPFLRVLGSYPCSP